MPATARPSAGPAEQRPLWSQLARRGQKASRPPPAPRATRTETWQAVVVTVVLGALTLASIVVGSAFGNVHGPSNLKRLVAWVAAPALVLFGVVLTRRLARMLGHVVASQTVVSAGTAMRLLVSAVGYILVLFGVFDILNVSVERLIVGGALTGVVLGIAAQQSLGNVFAGLVLLGARPFRVGDHVRVRSGALGGQFEGIVIAMSLTYVTIHTDGGPLKVPNSGMLAAAVGPMPVGPRVVDASGTVPAVGAAGGAAATAPPAHE